MIFCLHSKLPSQGSSQDGVEDLPPLPAEPRSKYQKTWALVKGFTVVRKPHYFLWAPIRITLDYLFSMGPY